MAKSLPLQYQWVLHTSVLEDMGKNWLRDAVKLVGMWLPWLSMFSVQTSKHKVWSLSLHVKYQTTFAPSNRSSMNSTANTKDHPVYPRASLAGSLHSPPNRLSVKHYNISANTNAHPVYPIGSLGWIPDWMLLISQPRPYVNAPHYVRSSFTYN